MGVIYELILGHEAEITNLAANIPLPESDVVWTKVLDPVTLAELFVILLHIQSDEATKFMDTPVFEEDDIETWIYEIPARYISTLAALNETQCKHAAHDWTAAFIMWKEIDEPWVLQLLEDIHKLAIRAEQQQMKLFLRCSL